MVQRTATVIGATGLVGSYIVEKLLEDHYYSSIRILTRRPINMSSERLEVKLIDFQDRESFKLGIDGSEAVFCAVGTTQKKVKGDLAAYRKVDYAIPVHAARYCHETGCSQFLLVSAVGANKNSSNFYLKLKGETEDAVAASQVRCVSIFRPSVILGERNESRPAESIGKVIMKGLSFALAGKFSKYKPIHAKDIAASMIVASKQNKPGVHIYEYDGMSSLFKT